ncbi:hypothetical protein D3C72_2354430 [compost metagenome]
MFEQQRFRFRVRHGDVNLLNQRHQRFRLTGGQIGAEITGKTFFKVFGFANIDNRTASVIHSIYARLAGYGFQERF